MEANPKLSRYIVILLSVVIIICSFRHHGVIRGQSNVITWDVYGYYLYLPAVFIYHDTREYHFADEHLKKYRVSSDLYQLKPVNGKLFGPGYTMGLAILWLPFFILAHAFVVGTHLYPADGLSFPYQLAIIVASWFYAAMGLWFLRKALLSFFSDYITALTILLIFLGTNYFHYACYESGMPHALLFSLYALLFYLVTRWHETPAMLLSISIGAVIGIACLARPSEVVAILFFILFGLKELKTLTQRTGYLWTHRRQVLIIVATGIITVTPQLLYWHINLGRWFYNGYYDHTFTFLKPHLIDGLFGYRKGWLIYTPIMLFALTGFFTSRIRQTGLLYAVLAYFIINIYIVFSWDTWWYASSFGCRALVQSYALLSIPFASFLCWVEKLKLPIRTFVFSLLGLCVLLNLFQDWQYLHNILPQDETTKIYYWKIFGKTAIADPQLRRYLDINEELPSCKIYSPLPLNNDCSDSSNKIVLSNSFGQVETVFVTDSSVARLSGQWIRLQADARSSGDLCSQWHEALLVLTAVRNGKFLKWTSVRFQGFFKPREWGKVKYEVQMPVLRAGDEIKAFIWNQGPDTIFQRCIQIQLLQEQQPATLK